MTLTHAPGKGDAVNVDKSVRLRNVVNGAIGPATSAATEPSGCSVPRSSGGSRHSPARI